MSVAPEFGTDRRVILAFDARRDFDQAAKQANGQDEVGQIFSHSSIAIAKAQSGLKPDLGPRYFLAIAESWKATNSVFNAPQMFNRAAALYVLSGDTDAALKIAASAFEDTNPYADLARTVQNQGQDPMPVLDQARNRFMSLRFASNRTPAGLTAFELDQR